jgi:hypothetical protein
MKYDIPLKTIMKNRHSSLRSALGIQGEWRELPDNFPAREDEVDFLAYVKNGRRRAYLAHVEFQSDRHPDMLTRMFGYRVDIRNWQQTSGDKSCKGPWRRADRSLHRPRIVVAQTAAEGATDRLRIRLFGCEIARFRPVIRK